MRYRMKNVLNAGLPCKKCWEVAMEFVAGRSFGVCSNCGYMLKWSAYAAFLHRNSKAREWYDKRLKDTEEYIRQSRTQKDLLDGGS